MVVRMYTPCYRNELSLCNVCSGLLVMSWFMPCKNVQSANPIKLAVSWLIVISRTRFYKINGDFFFVLCLGV